MAVTPIKALLFLAGGTAAAAATAYVSGVLDPYLCDKAAAAGRAICRSSAASRRPQRRRLPDAERRRNGSSRPTPPRRRAAGRRQLRSRHPSRCSGRQCSAPGHGRGTPAERGALAAAGGVPSFDVVRVEADGSMVIAGKAVPDAEVELLTGADVIGSADGRRRRRFRHRARRAAEARRLPDRAARHRAGATSSRCLGSRRPSCRSPKRRAARCCAWSRSRASRPS